MATQLSAEPLLSVRVGGDTGSVPPARASSRLKHVLVAGDAIAIFASWLFAVLGPALDAGGRSGPQLALTAPLYVAAGLAVLRWQRLYLARVCTLWTVEAAGVARVALTLGVVGYGLGQLGSLHLSGRDSVVLGVAALVLLSLWRGAYRHWLRTNRRAGQYTRRVVLVGATVETLDMLRLVEDNPELGLDVCGIVAPHAPWALGHPFAPWLAPLESVDQAVLRSGAGGALVDASAMSAADLNRTVRRLHAVGAHVHLSTGLRGLAYNRMRPLPLAREPLFYLEPVPSRAWQDAAKRALDVALSSLVLIATAPLLAVAALGIKLTDGGPVLFRQERIGKDGRGFMMYKLRTMTVDAESQLEALREANQRDGPLFKLARDPRVTRVGRVLRAASIDELPQLFNVLGGAMSLVGPRPALRSEVEQFDEELLARLSVKPGVTGLWQVEARDKTSFAAYRRLDLFYVENRSIALDLATIAATVLVVALRPLEAVRGRVRGVPAGATATIVLD